MAISDFAIRLACHADHGVLLPLWERSVRATHDFLTEADIDFFRPLVGQYFESSTELWVLTDSADVPIGFLGLDGSSIAALFMEPAYLGKGGGRRLVAHAQQLRGGVLTVDVNEQNVRARRFYEALGFSVVDRSPIDDTGRPFPLLRMRRGHMIDEVVIRPAVPTERATLEALQRRASLGNPRDRDALLANPDAIEVPLEQIAAGDVFVAERDGVIVGFAAVIPRERGAELDALFVEPHLWQRGIGRTLVDYCADVARRRASGVLHVIGNPHAEGFYAACGFRVIGTVDTRFGVGLSMQRVL